MKIIVGLGNPGKQYEKTMHNAGFLVVDILRKEFGFPPFEKKAKLFSEISQGEFVGEKILLVKPQTFMNESGKAVKAILNYYKITPENLWVIYDDVDLIEGTSRVRKKGSAGTHNGMKSIIAHLGHGNFPRFRIGIAREEMHRDIVAFILQPLSNEAWKCFQENIKAISKIVVFALEKGIAETMNTYN